MDYTKLEYHLSTPRWSRYLNACNNEQKLCHELYCANMKLSQGFYPLLSLFEVVFRNALHRELSRYFETSDWMRTQKKGFMSTPKLERSGYFLRNSIENAEKNIAKEKATITPEKIIGELSFGFWTSLFDVHHYKLIEGCVSHAFRDKHIDRKTLSKKLILIREFRNRIYHNEPICLIDDKVDVAQANAARDTIYELLKCIDRELPSYVSSFDNVPQLVKYF